MGNLNTTQNRAVEQGVPQTPSCTALGTGRSCGVLRSLESRHFLLFPLPTSGAAFIVPHLLPFGHETWWRPPLMAWLTLSLFQIQSWFRMVAARKRYLSRLSHFRDHVSYMHASERQAVALQCFTQDQLVYLKSWGYRRRRKDPAQC